MAGSAVEGSAERVLRREGSHEAIMGTPACLWTFAAALLAGGALAVATAGPASASGGAFRGAAAFAPI
ncbi:hypothetical protein OHO83_22930 [Streptomyces sp. NBC_00569]|uniref:hypothetical protein n=1 Tax=unclassified Streptomyces TaxID=2593676 RepID=UPI002250C339|nr:MULTISPECIES: hypothetical protein [unclassified Streptomyces]MCX5438519.1 hypothetical protein [Streptomyces sp. NBC_00063]WUB94935.1 hypothetical protein OHO83_22930 [Streptomyces sp. NBC_00569]